jgi:hypothetical protein
MPNLETHNGNKPRTKLLLVGDSGTGKTGALASLAKGGSKLRILDFDNKVAGGILPILVKRDCPDQLKNIEFEPLRDKLKASPLGPVIDGAPVAFTRALTLLDKWPDGTIPAKWGDGYVLVIDSLTFLSDAAFAWARGLNPGAKDPRQWFYSAQQAVENTIALLTSAAFDTDVVIIAHISYQNRQDGMIKGYPASVGQALGPTIPAYFEHMAMTHLVGGKRMVQIAPTALIDLKTPASFKLPPMVPIENGLADFFKTVKEAA